MMGNLLEKIKKNPNLISRDDKRLEEACELDGWGLAVFGETKEGIVHTEIYLREKHTDNYVFKFTGWACVSKMPEYLQKEFRQEQIKELPDCYMGKKETSCEKCIHCMKELFETPNYLNPSLDG